MLYRHEPGLQVVSMYVDQQADKNPHDETSEVGIHRQRSEEVASTSPA